MLYFKKWKITLILGVCFVGFIFVFPNFFSRDTANSFPGVLPSKQINLGLDLQGGSHLLLEIDVDTLVAEKLDQVADEVRRALREERIGYTGGINVDGRSVTLQLRSPGQVEQARGIIEGLAQPVRNHLGSTATDLIVDVEDDGFVTILYSQEAAESRAREAIDDSIDVVRRRIDPTGTKELTIQQQGADRILLQLPGEQDTTEVKRQLKQLAKLTFHLLVDEGSERRSGRAREGTIQVPSRDDLDANGRPIMYTLQRQAIVSGENLTNASVGTDSGGGGPAVNLTFDATGGRSFGRVTSNNVGRRFAIVLDGAVISAPVIRSAIIGGSAQITGGFTFDEATQLSKNLRAGSLPAPLKVEQERTVGPDLGADSVAAGKIASIIAFVLVMAFMIAAYGFFGLIANVALIVNIILIGGALSALQATLTLPGIAGVVLTIGMAVDANVLIFERIREETRRGQGPFAAVERGYKTAMTTIIDSNVTTLIAAALLLGFAGSGPVKGFGVTLALGIISSMFTATILTRLIIATWLRRRRRVALPI